MLNYEKARIKITNSQLKKIKPTSKNKTRITLGITKKNFQDEELPHELSLTIRQKTKIRNAFTKNMPTDIKLSKGQLSQIIQLGGFFGKALGNVVNNLTN